MVLNKSNHESTSGLNLNFAYRFRFNTVCKKQSEAIIDFLLITLAHALNIDAINANECRQISHVNASWGINLVGELDH